MKNIIFLGFLAMFFLACDPGQLTTDVREPLKGSWTCKETGGLSYQVNVSSAPFEDDKMYFNNLYKLNGDVEVMISGSTLSIPTQTVDNFELKGSGSVSSDKKKITLGFTADGDPVEATMTKN